MESLFVDFRIGDHFEHLLGCMGETLGKSIADAVSPLLFARV
jgi:hypothetical protein